jgi:hypothetical protein
MRHTSLNLLLAMALAFAGCTWRSSPGEFDDQIQPDQETVLECTLEVEQKTGGIFHRGGIFATVVFKNPTDHRERVLKEVLLDEGPLGGPPFIVTKDGKYVNYTGAMVNKGPPTEDDWRVLKPGESFVRKIRMNDYYDLSAPGEYQVVCERLYFASARKIGEGKSNTVKFVVSE